MARPAPALRVALLVAYDGSDFAGFQSQANGRAVQDVLEAALGRLYGAALRVRGASRTDAGVHALGQVVSFDLGDPALAGRIPLDRLPLALDGLLPPDVRVLGARTASASFDPRRAVRKHYRYRLLVRPAPCPLRRREVWHVPPPLDLGAMARAAAQLAGRHDFAAFAASGGRVGSTVRHLERLEVRRACPDEVHVEAVADGFLYHMVRNLVGTLVEVGRGRRRPEEMASLLASRRREAAGATAPARGLCLLAVEYGPEHEGPWLRAGAGDVDASAARALE